MKRSPLTRKTPLKAKPSLKRSRLNPVSDKRKVINREYLKRRAEYLTAHPYCQATIRVIGLNEAEIISAHGNYINALGNVDRIPLATDIHHTAGRIGENLLNQKTWLAVSRNVHRWIHDHPSKARQIGLLAP